MFVIKVPGVENRYMPAAAEFLSKVEKIKHVYVATGVFRISGSGKIPGCRFRYSPEVISKIRKSWKQKTFDTHLTYPVSTFLLFYEIVEKDVFFFLKNQFCQLFFHSLLVYFCGRGFLFPFKHFSRFNHY